MRLWQTAMISLATNNTLKKKIQNTRIASQLARRFVGGVDEPEAVLKTAALKSRGLSSSFFYLGEYVRDPAVIDQTLVSLEKVIALAAGSEADLHISVDPTQAGLIQGQKTCMGNLKRLARQVDRFSRPGYRDILMIDMEDSSVTQATIDLYQGLIKMGLPAAITLQAYLYRTPGDLDSIMGANSMVRLVKGAFAENNTIAHTQRGRISRAYLNIAMRMLDRITCKDGFYPVFATHDHLLIDQICELASKRQILPGQYEFEMLYGVRPSLQNKLARQGHGIRIYLPYGRDFWPYAIRRIGENPKNIKFLVKSLLPGCFHGKPVAETLFETKY